MQDGELELAAEVDAPRRARDALRAALEADGVAPGSVEVVLLLVSVSNAVEHARTPLTIRA